MAIRIQNLRITPYSAKDSLKVVFGDEMELTFTLPHVEGESFLCGLDSERVVYPPSRPICAYTSTYTRDGDDVTFKLKLTTSRLRDYVSHIRKPMPVWLQVVRVVGGKYETVLLDDILALPSVIDGAMTVCEGDPLGELLEGKMDKPYAEGTEGQVLTMGADGHYAWADLPEIPEQEQADWDESDSSEKSFIQNKPRIIPFPTMEPGQPLRVGMVLTSKQGGTTWADATDKRFTSGMETVNLTMEDGSTVQTNLSVSRKRSGGINQFGNDGNQNYVLGTDLNLRGNTKVSMTTPSFEYNGNQLNTAGGLVEVGSDGKVPDGLLVNADWDESDSTEASFIKNKPDVYTKGETDTLLDGKADKATTLAGYGITDAYTKTEVDQKVASVYRYKGTVSTYADLPSSGQEVGDVYNVETADSGHGIKAGDNVAWNGTTWDVLAGEIVFPEQVQADWDESDSESPAYILNKPVIPTVNDATVTINQGGVQKGTFTLNQSGNATVNLNDGAQSDWDESDSSEVSYIKNKPETIKNYFTIKAKSAGTTVQYLYKGYNDLDLEWSTDDGATWTAIHFDHSNPSDSQVWTLAYGKSIMFRGNNDNIGNMIGVSSGEIVVQSRFVFTGSVELSGKLTSLLDKSCMSDTIKDGQTFECLFACLDTETTYNQTPIDASSLIFPTNTISNCLYKTFQNCNGLTRLPNVFGTACGYKIRQTFEGSGITGKIVIPYLISGFEYGFDEAFKGCLGITSVEIMMTEPVKQSISGTFNGCSNLHDVTVHFTSWKDANNNDVWEWVDAPATGVWRCPKALDTTVTGINGVPTGWTVEYIDEQPVQSDWDESDSESPAYILNKPTIPTVPSYIQKYVLTEDTSSSSTVEVAPSGDTSKHITVASALTLSATAIDSGSVAYSEVVIDLATGATVTAGTNLTLVDTPTENKRNVCVVRWSGGVAKLYVTIVEDLPQA